MCHGQPVPRTVTGWLGHCRDQAGGRRQLGACLTDSELQVSLPAWKTGPGCCAAKPHRHNELLKRVGANLTKVKLHGVKLSGPIIRCQDPQAESWLTPGWPEGPASRNGCCRAPAGPEQDVPQRLLPTEFGGSSTALHLLGLLGLSDGSTVMLGSPQSRLV